MESMFRFLAPLGPCGYLPDQVWRLEYEMAAEISPAEYMQRMLEGWRRFGFTLFRPRCPACSACQSLRVDVRRFRPNRSQRRVAAANAGRIRLQIGTPSVTRGKLDLYDRYHAYQSEVKGWPPHESKDSASYVDSFVNNPFPTQEWCYYLESRLVGVGYVDDLPGGLSAIYFFYDPDDRELSLGTWNVLSVIAEAGRRAIPHVYLGYYVAGCPSMQYKSRFRPHQLRQADGTWRE